MGIALPGDVRLKAAPAKILGMSQAPTPFPQFLAPNLPALKPGQRPWLSKPAGSADALLLAELARSRHPAGDRGVWVVVTSDPADAQRLLAEMQWFAPGLRCGERAPQRPSAWKIGSGVRPPWARQSA